MELKTPHRALIVLDVPVLDLDHGGVLAVREQPGVDRIFLAGLGLGQHRRPMRPVLHRIERGDAAGEVLLRHGAGHGVMLEQPVRLEHEQIARGVGRLVDAILLRRIARGRELHARRVLDAELMAHLHLHMGDGVSHAAALLERRVGALHLGHDRRNFGDVLRPEGVRGLLLAGIGVADGDAVPLRRGRAESDVVEAPIVAAARDATRKPRGEQYDRQAAVHALIPLNSRASRAEETTERGKRQAPAGHAPRCFACLFSDAICPGGGCRSLLLVMAGLVPAIHVLTTFRTQAWIMAFLTPGRGASHSRTPSLTKPRLFVDGGAVYFLF